MYPLTILTPDAAESVRGWTGANPYGMVRLSLLEYVALQWASETSDYLADDNGGGWVARVRLNPEDHAFLSMVDAIDNGYTATDYPRGVWSVVGPFPRLGLDVAGDGEPVLMVYVDDRGWPTVELLPASVADAHWSTLEDRFYGPADDDED